MANQTRQLAELLEQEGATVEVVQVNAPYRPRWAGGLRGIRALFRLVPYLWRLWFTFGRANLVHVMANSGWSWHLFAAPAIWLASIRGVPVVVNYRGGEADRFLASNTKWVKKSMRKAAALILPSGYLLEVFARYGMSGQVIPNIVNVERFQPDPDRVPEMNAPHIIVARNLEAIYGNDLALKAFARIVALLPEARLSIAGSGPERDALRSLADELGIGNKVRFTGRLDRDQMAELYRQADVMLNPTRVDNMPNSVLEALASGLPVVCTRVGGVPFIVEHRETAMLVAPEDPGAIAVATLELLTRPDLRARIVGNGLIAARRYRWSAVRDRLARAYSDAVESAKTPGAPAW